MTVNRAKKSRKHRGTRTCGWGLTHRGTGKQGGAGNSGGGKRCHSRKHFFGPDYLGKTGFKKKGQIEEYESISIKELTDKLPELLEKKLAEKKEDFYKIDLIKLGYKKLLSQGRVDKKMNIKTKYFSERAKAKIEEKGGTITV